MENTKIKIPVPELFNKDECLWFLNRDFDDCMYRVYKDRVRRAFGAANGIMIVDIYMRSNELVLEWLNMAPSNQEIERVVQFASEWFDLNTDLTPFYNAVLEDKRIAYIAEDYSGLRFIGIPDLFEALAWGIIGQQINLSFAYKIKRRLVEQYGASTVYEGERYHVFPTTQVLSEVKIDDLRALQFSEKKAEYLIAIAQAFSAGTLNKELLQALPDLESRIKYLTNIRGIGQWTANYTLMKSLKEPACIPHGDAGLLNALINHGIIDDKNDKASINDFFKSFAGWESYLVFYLWRTLAQPKE